MHCANKSGDIRQACTSDHPADSVDRGLPRCTKLLAAGLYGRARGEERPGSTSAPRLKYGAWMATPPTPVSAPLRSQNGWRLEASSCLESTRRRMRPEPNARPYAGQETHTRTACDSSPYRKGQRAPLRATACHSIQASTPQPSAPPHSPCAALLPRRTKTNKQIIKEQHPPDPRPRPQSVSGKPGTIASWRMWSERELRKKSLGVCMRLFVNTRSELSPR
jgi:hypothetical protein